MSDREQSTDQIIESLEAKLTAAEEARDEFATEARDKDARIARLIEGSKAERQRREEAEDYLDRIAKAHGTAAFLQELAREALALSPSQPPESEDG